MYVRILFCVCGCVGEGINFCVVYLGLTRDLQNLTASTKGDSESDLQDQTPDTDDSGAHSYPEVSSVSSLGCATGSFKRAPIMGNRGLEQRGKKTKAKDTTPVSFIFGLL